MKYSTDMVSRFSMKKTESECYTFIQFRRKTIGFYKYSNKNLNSIIHNELKSCLDIIIENKISEYKNIFIVSQKCGQTMKNLKNF